jgi:hypothetical protein
VQQLHDLVCYLIREALVSSQKSAIFRKSFTACGAYVSAASVQQFQWFSPDAKIPDGSEMIVMNLIRRGFALGTGVRFAFQTDLKNDFFLGFLHLFDFCIFQFQQFCCILFLGQVIRLLSVFSSITLYQFANHLSFFLCLTPTFIIEP